MREELRFLAKVYLRIRVKTGVGSAFFHEYVAKLCKNNFNNKVCFRVLHYNLSPLFSGQISRQSDTFVEKQRWNPLPGNSVVNDRCNLGSAFFHGSHTVLGNTLDNFMISVLSYLMHQAAQTIRVQCKWKLVKLHLVFPLTKVHKTDFRKKIILRHFFQSNIEVNICINMNEINDFQVIYSLHCPKGNRFSAI